MQKLKTIDADTLTATPLPALRFVVDGLLPQGLHILAGAPKIGKSWLALWLCVRVARGESVWGFSSTQGSVLYLCLEDSYARIQRRLFQITEDAPADLHFANLSERIGEGLEAQLQEFFREHPDTKLVVVDTLQKVRGAAADSNPYASDYRDISALSPLADQQGAAILLIHHLRKMNDDDPFNMISGTTGISGAADSSFVLRPSKRGSSTATLFCTGRDIGYRELSLQFQKETHIDRWIPKQLSVETKLQSLLKSIDTLEEKMEVILMERIRDKANAERYDRMIQKREAEISALRKQIEELENIEDTLKQRQATLRRDIRLMDSILVEGHISEANLRLLVEKIYISERDGKLDVDIHLKAPFQTHGMLYEDGEITDAWSSLDYDWDRLGAILMEDLCENESVAVLSAIQG